MREDGAPYITVAQGSDGWYAVMLSYDEIQKVYEPQVKGHVRYDSREAALAEAVDWAHMESLELES